MLCGSGGSKSWFDKAAARSHLAGREIENCTRLWRETHFQVKIIKAHRVRSTFGSSSAAQKVHAAVARRTFPQHNAKNDSASEHFWKFSGCESAHVSGAERISKSEALHSRSTFLEVKLLKKCMASVAGSKFRNQHGKNITCPLTFERSSIVFQGRGNGACAFKSGPNVWFFVAVSKTSRCSAFERICKDAFRMAGAAQETSPSNMLGGQGADLLAMVALWSIR